MTGTGYIALDTTDLVIAASLILINGALSVALSLGIARAFFIATVRMIVQLTAIGAVLGFLFAQVSPGFTLMAATIMILFAGWEVMMRQERRLTGVWAYGLGTGTMLFAAGAVSVFALTTQVQPDPWFHPRYALPLLGMVLGNTMTGVSLGLDTFTTGAVRERDAIEAQLALGATRQEALLPLTRDALRAALMPIINSMAATGVVYLPGMMTGQILAGIPPAQAVQYQILIMFLLAGGTGIGAITAVMGSLYRLTDDRHRLRLDRLRPARSKPS